MFWKQISFNIRTIHDTAFKGHVINITKVPQLVVLIIFSLFPLPLKAFKFTTHIWPHSTKYAKPQANISYLNSAPIVTVFSLYPLPKGNKNKRTQSTKVVNVLKHLNELRLVGKKALKNWQLQNTKSTKSTKQNNPKQWVQFLRWEKKPLSLQVHRLFLEKAHDHGACL